MTGSIRNFEKLNFTPKSSVFCFSQGQTSEYDRLALFKLIARNEIDLRNGTRGLENWCYENLMTTNTSKCKYDEV